MNESPYIRLYQNNLFICITGPYSFNSRVFV